MVTKHWTSHNLTLKTKALKSFETSGSTCLTTQRNVPQDSYLQTERSVPSLQKSGTEPKPVHILTTHFFNTYLLLKLLIYGLFNDVINRSYYTASNNRMAVELQSKCRKRLWPQLMYALGIWLGGIWKTKSNLSRVRRSSDKTWIPDSPNTKLAMRLSAFFKINFNTVLQDFPTYNSSVLGIK